MTSKSATDVRARRLLRRSADPASLQARSEVSKPRNLWVETFDRLLSHRLAAFGLVIICLVVFMATIGPLVAPYGYNEQNLLNTEAPPSWSHWAGTDELGRDMLSRVIYGARTALLVAVLTSGLSTLVGLVVGALAAYLGGWIDTLLMRLADLVMSFPTFLLAVFVNATLKPPLANQLEGLASAVGVSTLASPLLVDYMVVFGALALVQWPGLARLVRGQVLSLRQTEFVLGAAAIGAPTRRILRAHILPNAIGPVIIWLTVGFGWALLAESGLSFIGVGVQPPAASWGQMMNENLGMWRYKPHLVLVPGAVVALVVLAFNMLGDGLNDALDPRHQRSR
jgi:peptide/nickel transport system permease protein